MNLVMYRLNGIKILRVIARDPGLIAKECVVVVVDKEVVEP